MNTFLVFQVAITVLSYGLFLLFIIVDGIRYSNGSSALFLFVPYAIACYALVRTINTTMRHREPIKTVFFLFGLLSFSSLA